MTDLAVRAAVERALVEDLMPLGDLSAALIPPGVTAVAGFVCREPGVVAGTAAATEVFAQIDTAVTVDWRCDDGHRAEAGEAIGVVYGRLASILTAERTALNFLSHLSGVATTVSRYVDAVSTTPTRIWDTRKTTPGLRALEKAAVRAGGGLNHRGNLSDWVMLKDNHLLAMSIAEAVAAARDRWPGRTVHVECDRMDQVAESLAAGADALLLDNMTPEEVREAVTFVDDRTSPGARRPLLEVSGGVTLETAAVYAATGVDLISVGRMTNSAPALDVGLDVEPDIGDLVAEIDALEP